MRKSYASIDHHRSSNDVNSDFDNYENDSVYSIDGGEDELTNAGIPQGLSSSSSARSSSPVWSPINRLESVPHPSVDHRNSFHADDSQFVRYDDKLAPDGDESIDELTDDEIEKKLGVKSKLEDLMGVLSSRKRGFQKSARKEAIKELKKVASYLVAKCGIFEDREKAILVHVQESSARTIEKMDSPTLAQLILHIGYVAIGFKNATERRLSTKEEKAFALSTNMIRAADRVISGEKLQKKSNAAAQKNHLKKLLAKKPNVPRPPTHEQLTAAYKRFKENPSQRLPSPDHYGDGFGNTMISLQTEEEYAKDLSNLLERRKAFKSAHELASHREFLASSRPSDPVFAVTFLFQL